MIDAILSQLANGLVLGFLYILIAVGLSIIFGLLGIVNFAHGEMMTVAMYAAVQVPTLPAADVGCHPKRIAAQKPTSTRVKISR